MNTIQSNLDLSSYLGETLWKQFVAYRREDTYQNDNYISDGLSNTELFEKANAFINEAQKNIYKSANLQHSISTTLKNLLMMKEFESIVDYFEVGNWIRVKVDGDIYKLRLISYEISLAISDANNISVEFSDVVKVSDGISDIQKILSQSKSISSSYSSVKRQAKSGNEGNKKVDKWINDGLSLNNIKILEDAENQNIKFDNNGILCREYLPLIDEYSDQQLKIINKGIYLTDDKWNTAKVGIGEIEYNGNKYYGVNGEILIGNILMGNELHIIDKQTGRDILTVVDGRISTQIQDNNTNYVDGHIADSATEVRTYADTQITQTAEKITSEATARLEATVGYSGKNILELTTSSKTQNGITFTVNKTDGTITVSGTATAQAAISFPFDIPSGDYYFSGCPSGGSASTYDLYAYDSDYSESGGGRPRKWDGTTRSDSDYGGTSQEIKIVNGHRNNLTIRIQSGVDCDNLVFRPMIRISSITDATFEPYHSVQTQITDTNSRIEQTADSITLQVNDNLNRAASSDAVEYKMPTDITINYYGYGLTDEVTTDTGKKASDNNGEYYLDRKTGKVYKSNGSRWVENRTLPQKLDDYYTSSQADAAIEVSARGIKQTVGNSTSKYDTTGYDIDYYGLDLPTAAGYPASKHNGKFYLNQSTGFVYKSNGTSWSKQNSTALPLISTQLGSKIDQTAESITSTVGKATNTYDTTGYTIHYYGFGFKKNDDGTINYAITDSGNKASENNNKYFLDQSTGYLYKSNNSVWAEPNPVVHFTPITTKLNSKIEQTADSITQTVSATYSTKDETTEKANAAQANAISAASTDATNKANAARNGANADRDAKLQNYYTRTEVNSKITQTSDSITSEVSKKIRANVGYDDDNLIDFTNVNSTTKNGITFTVDKTKGCITANGKATANASLDIPVTVVGNYYLSGGADGGEANKYLMYGRDSTIQDRVKKHDGVTKSDYLYDGVSGTEVKYVQGNTNRVRILIYNGQEVSNLVFSPAITEHKKVSAAISETNSKIVQTDSQIRSDVSATYTTKDESNEAVTELNSSIAQTAESIKQSVSGVMSKYDTSEVSYTITLFGIGTPPQAGYEASDYNGEYYLNQSNGEVYLSNGSSWGSRPIKTLEMITTNLQTQITANANAISLKVSSDTFDSSIADVYDDISYTRQQLNSEIDVLPNEITLGVSQLVYGKPTKNLIPFVLEEKTYRGITCRREDDGSGYKLTGIATSNTWFSLYTTDASVSFTNSKLADKKTIANGNYIVNGEGFSSAIQYRVEKGTDSSTYSSLCKYSGETDGKPLNVTTDSSKPYIRHYIWIASGTDMGTDGVIVRPMIRDASIADSTYTPGIDSGKYMCSAINLTPEKLELDAGKLIINSGNFRLDGSGTMTSLSGKLQTSGYTPATSSALTSGGQINLGASTTPGTSDLLIDTAKFKVTGDGIVTATGANIIGGSFSVDSSTTSQDDTSYISLQGVYSTTLQGITVKHVTKATISPGGIRHTYREQVGTETTSAYTTQINGGIISVAMDSLETYIQGDAIRTGLVVCDRISTYSSSATIIDTNLTFSSGKNIKMADKEVLKIYEGTLSVGSVNADLPLRLYGSTIWANNPITTPSDARRKHNIESLDNRYLDIVKSIEPKRFKYLANPLDRYHTGYIAQDVQTAMKKLNVSVDELSAFVDVNGDGSDLALRYGEFIPLLHKWLKELDNRVTAIEKRKE